MSRALEVIAPGPLTLIEDLGRPGLAHLGVGTSGAADRTAYLLGNRLLGNPPGHASLEVTYGGLHVRVRGALTVGREVLHEGVVARAGRMIPPPRIFHGAGQSFCGRRNPNFSIRAISVLRATPRWRAAAER